MAVKDHALLLRAFRRVAAQTPGAQLLVAGEGPLAAGVDVRTQDFTAGSGAFPSVLSDATRLYTWSMVNGGTTYNEVATPGVPRPRCRWCRR